VASDYHPQEVHVIEPDYPAEVASYPQEEEEVDYPQEAMPEYQTKEYQQVVVP
jgi:hypothetical protein